MKQVTFIISTYRRPEALRCTLRTLLMQTHQDWDALVIGDHCGPETEAAIRSVQDPRIAYYNLPQRFGEQSGPNSAGLHLARGDFVCFLNQDDLLLKDHLVRALARLETCDGDVYFGKFANANKLEHSTNGARVATYGRILPEHADMRELMMPNHNGFDPSSFWVVRRSFADAVGPWRPAITLRRTPVCDWLLRAWRLGGTFSFGDTVTGIRMWTHNVRPGRPSDAPIYFDATPENEALVERLQHEGPDETRTHIERRFQSSRGDQRPAADISLPRRFSRAYRARYHRAARELRRRLFTGLYLRFGVDPVSVLALLSGHPKGMVLQAVTRKRIGEGLPSAPTIEGFLSAPESHRLL